MGLYEKTRIKISVVVPTYKRPRLLMRCVDALLKQTFPANEFEIIVVSDGYDISSFHAVGRYTTQNAPTIRYYNLPKKAGPAAARNRGWQQAVGELIAFTDDDCIPSPNWLNELWQAYQASKLSEVALSGKTRVPISRIPTDYERNIGNLERAEFITANCACTRKSLLKVGGLDERFTMAWREDSDLQFKFIERSVKILPVQSAEVTHPVRKAKWGVSIKEEKKGIFNALLFKKYPRLYKQKIESKPPWHYYLIVICLLVMLISLFVEAYLVCLVALGAWFMLTLFFALKRLASTRKTASHICEMLVTSMIIPVLSLYYRWYGSIKFGAMLIP